MADKTLIEWSDATWNPITGCTLVDEGCRHCYAAHLITSWPAIGNHPSRKGLARKNAAGEAKFTGEWGPVVIEENDGGALGPAYPITGCGDPTAHRSNQPAIFWQGDDLVQWPHIKMRQAIGARRIGKKAAGRVLDGREWNEFPKVVQ